MSVLVTPTASGHARGPSLPAYDAIFAPDTKVGATYPPAMVKNGKQPDLATPSKAGWLFNTVSMCLLLGAATLVKYLGYDDFGNERWLPAIAFWTNDVPLPKSFARDEVTPPQSALIALGILHIFDILFVFVLFSILCFRQVGHGICLPADRLARIIRRTTHGFYWASLLGIAGAWAADYYVVKKAERATDNGIVMAILDGGSVTHAIPWAFLCIALCGIVLQLERKRQLKTNAQREANIQRRRTKLGAASADVEVGNPHVGAPTVTAAHVIGNAEEEEPSRPRPSSADAPSLTTESVAAFNSVDQKKANPWA